ncbi:MAG: MarR family transcriptional regulator [Gemmatimonadota bacterium]|nr:MarR family transcriptional regulator [Gemmatimonadota bacterium]
MSTTLEATASRSGKAKEHDTQADDRSVLRTWLRLLACTNIIENRVRTSLRAQFDTTLPRFDLLAQLDAAAMESPRGITMSELSRRLMVTNGNLTGLVERLAREGLVTRTASLPDRRAQIVSLTPEGKRALDSMTPEHAGWVRDMFEGLSDSDRHQLYTLLGKLKRSALLASERES